MLNWPAADQDCTEKISAAASSVQAFRQHPAQRPALVPVPCLAFVIAVERLAASRAALRPEGADEAFGIVLPGETTCSNQSSLKRRSGNSGSSGSCSPSTSPTSEMPSPSLWLPPPSSSAGKRYCSAPAGSGSPGLRRPTKRSPPPCGRTRPTRNAPATTPMSGAGTRPRESSIRGSAPSSAASPPAERGGTAPGSAHARSSSAPASAGDSRSTSPTDMRSVAPSLTANPCAVRSGTRTNDSSGSTRTHTKGSSGAGVMAVSPTPPETGGEIEMGAPHADHEQAKKSLFSLSGKRKASKGLDPPASDCRAREEKHEDDQGQVRYTAWLFIALSNERLALYSAPRGTSTSPLASDFPANPP